MGIEFITLDEIQGEPYYEGRWPYLRIAAGWAKAGVDNPTQVFELGAHTHPVVHGCHTMDIKAQLHPTFVHDARVFPWPIADGAYSLFIGLQVLEHLGAPDSGVQALAFLEVRRIAKSAIISVPYHWTRSKSVDHNSIGIRTVLEWSGIEPDHICTVAYRIICQWTF